MTFRKFLDKPLSYLSAVSVAVAGVTAFIEEAGKLTNLSFSIIALLLSVSWCVYVFISKKPSMLVGSEPTPMFGKRMKIIGIAMSAISLIFIGNASYKIHKSKIPNSIQIIIVNHTGSPIDYLERKAEFFIKKPDSLLYDKVIDSGIIELNEPVEESLSGPWIKLRGSTNKLVGKIRNKKRFQKYYEDGEYEADVVFNIGNKLYRETVKFSQDGIGILINSRWVR